MNIVFLGWLLLMILFAIAMLVYPLLRVRNTSSLGYKDSNLSINDDKLNELEQDLSDGRIDQQYYNQAHDELDRELLRDIPENNSEDASYPMRQIKRKPIVALIIAVFIPLTVYLVYLDLGMPAVTTNQPPAKMVAQPQMSIPQMAEKLRQRIEKTGGNVQDWTMLGRAYKFMKEYSKSSQSFAEALKMSPDNAVLMLERAEVLALLNNRQFVPEARKLILHAIRLKPNNVSAIWFAGVAEFQAGSYRKSIAYLTRLAKTNAISNKNVRLTITSYVTEARKKLMAQGISMPALDAMAAIKKINNYVVPAKTAAANSVAQSKSKSIQAAVLHIRVRISDKVKQQFKGSADVFVYAKARQGPRMPLAVKRMKLSQFPATVVLDDSMAMMQGMNISAFGQVVVSARVTRSGSAIARAGDYIGTAEVNDVHTDKIINITINKVVK